MILFEFDSSQNLYNFKNLDQSFGINYDEK